MKPLSKERGKWVDKIGCTSCSSTDALVVYEKNSKYDATCFSCGHYEPNPPGYSPGDIQIRDTTGSSNKDHMRSPSTRHHIPTNREVLEDFKTYPIRALPERGITQETAEKYGVRVSLSPQDGETTITHMYPYYKDGNLSGYKERIVATKTMFSKGDCIGASLFGSHCHKPNGKTLFVTEGECDAMALYQVLRSLSDLPHYDPAVVSLSHGSASAAKDISQDYDYVNSFEKVVLVFDQDEPGQRAVEDACKILAGKVYVAKLSEKDPNDMLLLGKADEMKWDVLKHARQYMPDNIVNYADCWDRYKNARNQECYYFPDEWSELNKKTYGIRLGELVTITSGSGMGGLTFSPFVW